MGPLSTVRALLYRVRLVSAMPFPQLITSSSGSGPQGNGTLGPWKIGSKLYIQLQNTTTSAPQIWASSDLANGATWAQVGVDGFTPADSRMASIAVGTKIYVFLNLEEPTDMLVGIFDTTVNTWSGPQDTGVLAPGAGTKNTGMAYRSITNDIVVMGDNAALFVGGSLGRCAYSIYNVTTGTCSAWVPCGQTSVIDPNAWMPTYNPVVRGTGRTHFFFTSQPVGVGTSLLVQQTLEDSAVLEAFATIDSKINITNTNLAFQIANSNVGEVVIAWQPFNAGNVNTFKGVSAATITFTEQIIITATDNSWCICVGDDSNVYFVLGDSVSGNTVVYKDIGSGFGSPLILGVFAPFQLFLVNYPGGGLSKPAMMFLAGSEWFAFLTFAGSAAGTAALLNQNARVIILPDPRIHCVESNRFLARQSGACRLEFPLQIGKIHAQPDSPEPAGAGSRPDQE